MTAAMADDDDIVELLGPTVEQGWAFLRDAARSDVPRSLRPMLGFRRLSTPAVRQIVRVLDDDDELRERVAVGTAASTGDPIGRLWLERPDGWRGRFDELLEVALERRRHVARAEAELELRERVTELEEELGQAEARLGDVRRQTSRLQAELADERSQREAAQQHVAELTNDLQRVEAERAKAVSELQRARRLADRRLEQLRSRPAAKPDPEPTIDREKVQTELRRQRDALRAQLQAVKAQLDELSDNVDRGLRDASDAPESGTPTSAPPVAPSTAETAAASAERSIDDDVGLTDGEGRPLGTKPALRLPGLRDDSLDAARYLVDHSDQLIVDGYNASILMWPDLPLADQRDRLLQRLGRLASGSLEVVVIFDGGDGVYARRPGQRRTGQARAEFSPEGVEADEVIIERCRLAPRSAALVVASNDRRVRDGARAYGAHVLSIDQLVAVSGGS